MSPAARAAQESPAARRNAGCEDDTAFLDHIQIASPCSAAWEDMTGDDVVRHCGLCKLDVYDLSGLTRQDAAALVRQREGRLCVRLYQRADGTLISDDCRARLRKARQRGLLAFVAALVVVGVIQLAAQLASLGLLVGARSGLGGQPLTGSPVALQGDVADPGTRLGQVAPPAPLPLMGEPAPIQIRTPPEARRPITMGKIAMPRE